MTGVQTCALPIFARANLNRYQLESRAALVQGNLGDPLPPGQRLILANLPYIPSARIATLAIAAAEPRFALDGGPDGFELIRKLLVGIRGKVANPFLILCEIDDTHAEIACDRRGLARIAALAALPGIPPAGGCSA